MVKTSQPTNSQLNKQSRKILIYRYYIAIVQSIKYSRLLLRKRQGTIKETNCQNLQYKQQSESSGQ